MKTIAAPFCHHTLSCVRAWACSAFVVCFCVSAACSVVLCELGCDSSCIILVTVKKRALCERMRQSGVACCSSQSSVSWFGDCSFPWVNAQRFDSNVSLWSEWIAEREQQQFPANISFIYWHVRVTASLGATSLFKFHLFWWSFPVSTGFCEDGSWTPVIAQWQIISCIFVLWLSGFCHSRLQMHPGAVSVHVSDRYKQNFSNADFTFLSITCIIPHY